MVFERLPEGRSFESYPRYQLWIIKEVPQLGLRDLFMPSRIFTIPGRKPVGSVAAPSSPPPPQKPPGHEHPRYP